MDTNTFHFRTATYNHSFAGVVAGNPARASSLSTGLRRITAHILCVAMRLLLTGSVGAALPPALPVAGAAPLVAVAAAKGSYDRQTRLCHERHSHSEQLKLTQRQARQRRKKEMA